MQLNLTAANQNKNFLKLATSVKEAQEAAKTNNVNRPENSTVTNPTVNQMERQPEKDGFEKTPDEAMQDLTKKAIKGATGLYLAGFCFGFAPGLFMLAAGAFLFSNKGESFRDKLANEITSDLKALNQFAQMQARNMQQAQNVQPAQNVQQGQPVNNVQAAQPAQNVNATNPIQNADKAQEEKPMTPLERAQQRYAKAQDYQTRAQANVERKEQAQRLAEEKVELAQAKLDKAQMEYDKAKAEVKAQMTDRMMKLQQSLSLKQANAVVAKERADVARATLQEAEAKLAKAQTAYEDLKAEEIVDVD